MNENEFKEKLSQVAEWIIPRTEQETTKNAKKRRGRKSTEEAYQEEHEEVFLEMFDGVNPSTPLFVTKIKIQAVDCEDCGEHCPSGRHVESKKFETNRVHWRKKCVTCKKNQNPWTGKFDLTSQAAAVTWADWLRKTNPRYIKLAQREKENNDGIITNYSEKIKED